VPKKLRRKELKQPDQFVGFWTRVSAASGAWARDNKRTLVIAIATAATVIVGSLVISEVTEGRALRAGAALERVRRIAAADLVPAGAPPKDDGVPHFPTEKARLEGALAALDASFSGPAPLYAEAQLVRGSLLLDLDRAPEAATVYERLLSDKLDQRLRFAAREGLGYAYERQGKISEAQGVFAKLGDDAGGSSGVFYRDRALYHQARLAELGGNRTEASRLYQEVLDKNPTTSLRDEITNRLAVLEIK
jgi:tetratricopeptide (TPR) repeat protein